MSHRLYVFDISYFSGKMEAYLRYKEIPYDRIEPSWRTIATEIYARTGLMKLPVIETPDGQWLQDTTPMIQWFEERYPAAPVIPTDPFQRFFSLLLEDYADEWLWRPALYYRWNDDLDADFYARRFVRDFLYDAPAPAFLSRRMARARQRRIYLRGDGVTDDTREHVESIYLNTLDRLERILVRTPYLLGDSPSLADFGFFASMFRHFSLDPTPSRIMRARAPAVYEWVARLWNARGSRLCSKSGAPEWVASGQLPRRWTPLLADIGDAYLPYLYANAVAWKDGAASFDVTVQGTTYRQLPTVQYRVWCREQLQRAYEELPESDLQKVGDQLAANGCLEPLLRGGVIPSHYREGEAPPVCQPRDPGDGPGLLQRLVVGTHWAMPQTRLQDHHD